MTLRTSSAGMTFIVKTITRFTMGFILLYGIYIALHGHLSPGGGFAGGIIVALSFVHVMLAFGKKVALAKMDVRRIRLAASLGAFLIWAIALASIFRGRFMADLLGGYGEKLGITASEIVLPLAEMVIVGSGFFLIVVVLVHVAKIGKGGFDEGEESV